MEVADVIRRIPALDDWSDKTVEIQRLEGLTNDNYRLIADGLDCILRLPRETTNRWINRETEQHNLNSAIAAGLAPPYRYFEQSGIMLSDNLSGCSSVTTDLLQNRDLLEKLVRCVRQAHDCQPVFKGQVDLPGLIKRYFNLMNDDDQQTFSDRYQGIRELLLELAESPNGRLVSSHNDLVLQNLLLQQDRLWLIDWEYSSLASPYWDLATLCNELQLDDAAASELLLIYRAGDSGFNDRQLTIYRTLLSFLSDCWLQAIHPPC